MVYLLHVLSPMPIQDVYKRQELDSMTHRSGQKYVLGEIAGRTQMHAYFAPAIDYDGGKYEMCIRDR